VVVLPVAGTCGVWCQPPACARTYVLRATDHQLDHYFELVGQSSGPRRGTAANGSGRARPRPEWPVVYLRLAHHLPDKRVSSWPAGVLGGHIHAAAQQLVERRRAAVAMFTLGLRSCSPPSRC
jgi:hypothetical protein